MTSEDEAEYMYGETYNLLYKDTSAGGVASVHIKVCGEVGMLPSEHLARAELVITLKVMCREYNRRLVNFWIWEGEESKEAKSGTILGALKSLLVYEQGYYYQDPDTAASDTYHWCLALHDCTKYLACDDRYKEKGWVTKDDRFKGMYQKNYYFRRRWVAFLRQALEYVELINRGVGEKPYASAAALRVAYKVACRDGENVHAQRAAQHRDLTGYDWERMKQEVATAQQKIDKETVWALRWANVKGQSAQRVEELLDELHRCI
jgi:hypothetical protein